MNRGAGLIILSSIAVLSAAVLPACGLATVEPTPTHPPECLPIEEYRGWQDPDWAEKKYWEWVGATAQAQWLEMLIASHDAWWEHTQMVEAAVEQIYYEVFPDRERLPLEGIAMQPTPGPPPQQFVPSPPEVSAEYDRAWALNETIVELYQSDDIAGVRAIFNDALWQKWFMPPGHLQLPPGWEIGGEPSSTPSLACPDPRVNITWPQVNAHVEGAVEIRGTANIENFQYYKIEFGAGANPAEGDWHWIGEGRNPVEQGLLLIWDTAGLSAGGYSVRLTAVDKTGNYPAPCQVQLYIDESVTATPTPVPPTPTPIPPSPTPTPTTPTFSGCPGGCTYHPPDCDIKGNISYETGEKIYHVPGGEYYDATVIRPEYGERWFCTEEEAIVAGWRRSKR